MGSSKEPCAFLRRRKVYANCFVVIINCAPFHSKKCPGLDDIFHGHFIDRVLHNGISSMLA